LTKAAGAIPGVTSAAAGWIGIAVAAVLAAITVISDIVDKATVSDKELTQNLATSDNELTSSA
jgi:hypothetical protein